MCGWTDQLDGWIEDRYRDREMKEVEKFFLTVESQPINDARVMQLEGALLVATLRIPDTGFNQQMLKCKSEEEQDADMRSSHL